MNDGLPHCFHYLNKVYDDKGRAIDARKFTKDLRKYLKGEEYGITSKLMTRGLGEAILVLGEK